MSSALQAAAEALIEPPPSRDGGGGDRPSERPIQLLQLPALGLYVISDAANLGPHWVRVHYKDGLYNTDYLLGGDDSICAVARCLARDLVESKLEQAQSTGSEDQNSTTNQEFVFMFSISLRDTRLDLIRQIGQRLRQLHQENPL